MVCTGAAGIAHPGKSLIFSYFGGMPFIDSFSIYLLDEPEAALSPLKQLALIAFVLEVLKKENVQFIMATHSPILMGIPGAKIYEIQEDGMQEVKYKETDHYRITKTFLDNPEYYLRHF